MNKHIAVRSAVFLMTLLTNADIAEPKVTGYLPPDGRHARCERCGQTGPTIPVAPAVFRVPSGDGLAVWVAKGAHKGTSVLTARASVSTPVRDEFIETSPKPAAGVAMTR